VEARSFARFGGEAGLDDEIRRRALASQELKRKQHAKKMHAVRCDTEMLWYGWNTHCLRPLASQLRKETMTSSWAETKKKQTDGKHQHVFDPATEVPTHSSGRACVYGSLCVFPTAAGRGDGRTHQDVLSVPISSALRENVTLRQ
jgi:hypothetical protein